MVIRGHDFFFWIEMRRQKAELGNSSGVLGVFI